jgi:hypothetical protein
MRLRERRKDIMGANAAIQLELRVRVYLLVLLLLHCYLTQSYGAFAHSLACRERPARRQHHRGRGICVTGGVGVALASGVGGVGATPRASQGHQRASFLSKLELPESLVAPKWAALPGRILALGRLGTCSVY